MRTFTTYRTIKREILFTNNDYDNQVKQYLFENMWYRRKIYNIGVEYIHKLEEYNANVDKKDRKYFNRFEFDKYFHKTYEKEGCPLHEEFKTKVKGIRAMVARNLYEANEIVWRTRKTKNISANLHFCKYNRNCQSFSIVNKYMETDNKTKRMLQVYNDGYKLKFHCYGLKSKSLKINLTLKESIYSDNKYIFNELDIYEVHFLFDNGKWFILLPTKVTMKFYYKHKEKLAGIDEGERNSVTLYDGENVTMINTLYGESLEKVKRIQKRISKVQSHMDNKVYGSNNYNKTLDHFNKLYRKMYNIANDRRKKLACYISRKYKNLIVDEFNVPIATKDMNITKDNRRRINKKMQLTGMGYFKQDLITACESYNSNYYKALSNTTRQCSNCGFINDPLPLSKKYLKCSICGTKIHRDENAAINCYNQYDEIDKYYNIMINI